MPTPVPMGYGLTNHLLLLCGGVFAASTAIAARRLSLWGAAAIAFFRVFLPLVYFAWYFDGQWTFIDDLEYIEHGELLVDQGFTPLSILSEESRNTLHSLAGGRHIFYSWWNLTTMWLFGTHYYVPVLLNVLITFLSGHVLSELALELRFPAAYRRVLYVFFLLHWDTLAWSSIVNLKDIITQYMTIAFFLCAIRAVRRRSWRHAAYAALLMIGFQYLRFYIPFIVGAAMAAWVILEWNDFRKYPLLAGILVVGVWLLPGRAYQLLESFSPFEVGYGIARFSLTPQPWDVADEYTFLLLPATLHWLMFLPATAGGVMLWRESRTVRLLLIYTVIMIVMYAMAEEIQGARQRVQLSFVFTWAQMHFLWRWTHTPASNRATSPAKALLQRPVHMRTTSPSRPTARTSA